MTKAFLREGLLWGALLWLFGYLLSFALFFVVPMAFLGWIITPFGLALTIWVAFREVCGASLGHYMVVGVIWTVLAVVLDYLLLVKLLKPADGYYKLDVYLYYISTFAVPFLAGWWKLHRKAVPA